LHDVRLFASGGLDEAELRALIDAGAPYDAFGVGSALVCSTDKAALDIAYKLVEYAGLGRAKYSAKKATLPGKKQVFRRGRPEHDVLELRSATPPASSKPLLELCWSDGQRLIDLDLERARSRAALALAELPDAWFLAPGPEAVPEPALGPALAAEVRAMHTLRPSALP
jgi:nicotinate phosphoribosyltransferase